MTDSTARIRQSLFAAGQLVARGREKRRWFKREKPGVPVAGLSIEASLVAAARHCGMETTVAQMVSGLPIPRGQSLDFRLAPIAFARLGIETETETLKVAQLRDTQCPALVQLRDEQFILVTGADKETLAIESADGARTMDRVALGLLCTGLVMVLGRSAPQDSEAAEDQERPMRDSPRRWIIGQFLQDRALLAQLSFVALLLNLCAFIVPMYMRSIYDRVVPNLAIETLWALSLGVLIALLFEFGLKTVKATFVDAMAIKTGLIVQHRVMARILGARIVEAPRQAGSVLAILRDIESLTTLIPSAITTLLIDLPFFLLFMVVIYSIGGPVVLSVAVGAMMIGTGGLIAHNGLNAASRKTSHLMRNRSNMIVDTVEGLPSVKAAQAGGRFLGNWDLLSDHLALGQRKIRKWSEKPAYVSALAMQLVTVGIIIIGVYQIKAGELSVGGLVACTLLAGRAMVPVSSAVQIIGKASQALDVYAGLARLLSLPQEPVLGKGIAAPSHVQGDFRCVAATVTMPGSPAPLLRDLNLRIQRGERVGIIGRSGCGKSTLLNLLAGMIAAETGQVTLDGRDIRQFPADLLRSKINYALQDGVLFNGSIEDNLLMAGNTMLPAQLQSLSQLLGINRFADLHPEGLQMQVGPRGTRLSGGQRQAVLLARALAGSGDIVMLDEPTAAMDVGTETMVTESLRRLTAGKTLILATHRLPLLELVDRVIWLENGRIVADKPRDQMMDMFHNQKSQARAA